MSLVKNGLWDIVNGTETAPPEESDSYPKFKGWMDRALATIVLSVDPSLLYMIGDSEDPVAVWKLLSGQFQKATWANRLALRRRLHLLRLKEGESVQDHIKAITEIFNELSMIGDEVKVEDKVVWLLASLPDSFDMLLTALEACPEVPEMGTVVERLLHEERKLKEKDRTPCKSGEGAFMAKQKRKGPRCHFCKRIGHIQRNCFERQKVQNQPNQAKDKYTRVNATDVKGDSESEVGLIVQHALSAAANREPGANWIIDSGATSHICNDSNYFVELEKLKKPVDVILEDGHVLKAEGRGTVVLLTRAMGQTRKCKLHDVLYVPKLTYNLLSVSRAVNRGISFVFSEHSCIIKDASKKLVTVADKVGNLYFIQHTEPNDKVFVAQKEIESRSKEKLWHRRYGHLGEKNLQKLKASRWF